VTIFSTVSKVAIAAIALSALFGGMAFADTGGLPVQQFFPAPGGDTNYFSQQGGMTLATDSFSTSAWFNFAQNMLVLRQTGTGKSMDVVQYNLQMNLQLAFGFANGGQLSIDVPVVLYQQSGPSTTFLTKTIAASSFGDIAIALKGKVYGQKGKGFKLAILGNLTIPTGRLRDMTGNGNVTFELKFVPEYEINGRVRLAANVGYLFRPDVRFLNQVVGNEFTFGAAASWFALPKQLELTAEIYGRTSADWTVSPTGASTPLELMFGAKYHMGGHAIVVGAGPGVTSGYGTPQYRVMLAYTFTMPDPPPPPPKQNVPPQPPAAAAPANEASGSVPTTERSAK
jgi:hypothetical protein